MECEFSTRRVIEIVGVTPIAGETSRFGIDLKDPETGHVARFALSMESAHFFLGAFGDLLRNQLDKGVSGAGVAAVDGLLDPDFSEKGVCAASGTHKTGASTVIADVVPVGGLKSGQLFLELFDMRKTLLKLRFLRFILGLKIGYALFLQRIFGLNKHKMFFEDCRRAVLVDQFFDEIESHRKGPRVEGISHEQ